MKDGKKNGEGTETYADGGKYVGEYKDGKANGQGNETYASGGEYVGQYKNGQVHGFGKAILANGTVAYDGEWENGKPKP